MDSNLTASVAGLSVGEGTPAISWVHLMAQKAESIMLLDWDCSMTCCKHEELREKGRRKNYFSNKLTDRKLFSFLVKMKGDEDRLKRSTQN